MVDAIGLRVVSGSKFAGGLPKHAPQVTHDEPQVRFEGSSPKIGRRFMWMALLTSILTLGGGGNPTKPVKADNINILDRFTEPTTPPTDTVVTETRKDPNATPELSWLSRKGPTRGMDVATLLEIADKKDKALDEKLKQADVKASKERLKRVTDAKEKLSKALADARAAHKKDPNSDDTTLKAKALIEACIADPSLRQSKETWAPNVVRWAACDQTQGAGFHKIADPFLDVLERPDTDGAYQAMLAVQRIPALATTKTTPTTVASVTPPTPPLVSINDLLLNPTPTRPRVSLTGLSGGTGSVLDLNDDLFLTHPARPRISRNPFEQFLRPTYTWNDPVEDSPFTFPPRRASIPRRNPLLLDLDPPAARPLVAANTTTAVPLSGPRVTTSPAISGLPGGLPTINNLFSLTPDLGPMPRIVNDPATTALATSMIPSGPWGMGIMGGGWGGWGGASGDGRPQVRFTSPNIDDLKGSWLKDQNKEMAGKRKIMVVYHAQEAFKPEVIIFIKKMASAYGLSLGSNKPEDIDKLIRAEKSADFGDFIVVCPKGKTAESDISAGFDRMEAFTKSTPGANGWVYVDAHGSEEGAEEGLEDLDMLEGSRKGVTHFPDDAKISKAFWMKQSQKLKGFKGAVPFWIDTCHSGANLVQAPTIANELRLGDATV